MVENPVKREASDTIEQFIANLEKTGREPDRYESDCVQRATLAYMAEQFSAAAKCIKLAAVPPDKRSTTFGAATMKQVTREKLRSGWQKARK